MSTQPTKTGPDWGSIWADLLRSTGRTLLRIDGSDLAEQMLTGLDEFEQAQERRRRSAEEAERRETEMVRPPYGNPEYDDQDYDDPAQGRYPERQSNAQPHRQEQLASRQYAAQRPDNGAPEMSPYMQLPGRPLPGRASPFEDWWLTQRLPLTPDGQLNLPRFRL